MKLLTNQVLAVLADAQVLKFSRQLVRRHCRLAAAAADRRRLLAAAAAAGSPPNVPAALPEPDLRCK
jgi:hypothetical protein